MSSDKNYDPYYDIPKFSNSFLSNVRFLVDNPGTNPPPLPEAALVFGSEVHYYVLEPHKFNGDARHKKCGDLIKSSPVINAMLQHGEIEKELHFNCLGLKCKGKMDLILGNTICDLKTTSCNTYEQFMETVKKYGYNRQAAFYMDGSGANKFIFCAVTKGNDPKLFWHSYDKHDPEIEAGRKEYLELLALAKAHKISPKGYKW